MLRRFFYRKSTQSKAPVIATLAIIMTKELTFHNLVSLIRELQGISNKTEINESTLLENDLGITGDDGSELLEAIETRFNLSFESDSGPSLREIFNLEKDQYLFHSEGVDFLGLIASFFGKKTQNVKPLSVGELFTGALKAKYYGGNG